MKRIAEFHTLLSGFNQKWLRHGAAALCCLLANAALWGGTLGKVVAIGGQASDIALDEGRGVLYIANYAANRIEVMNLADLSIPTSINVPLPGSMALSPDGRYLVVGTFGNFAAPGVATNALTVINLNTNQRQTFGMGSPPLGIAFGYDGKAVVVTSSEIDTFDPQNGVLKVIDTIANVVAKTLPQPGPAAPVTITETAVSASADGRWIVGTGTKDVFGFIYDVQGGNLQGLPFKNLSPPEGPRALALADDGSYFAFGWSVRNRQGRSIGDFINVTGAFEIGTYAVNSSTNTIYAQLPEVTPTLGTGPLLRVLDADNLTLRELLKLPENTTGRSVLNSARDTMYSVSESGVMVLGIGTLNQQRRAAFNKEDLVFRGNFCDRRINTQEVQIVDPGGGNTAFKLSVNIPGITISPSNGVTPATVRVSVDPNLFANQKGTVTGTITLTSQDAVNLAPTLRVLVNGREPDQRGTFVNVPGRLVDVLADPGRDRFYVLRNDKNQVLVFDGSNNTQIATLRTGASPSQLAITRDARYLLVAHTATTFVSVFDLETLQPSEPILFPVLQYPHSIAVSGNAILAAANDRDVSRGFYVIDRVDFAARRGTEIATLGPYENKFISYITLTSSPNGASIFGVSTDGRTLLYNANADAFTALRKDFTGLQGAYAASSNDQFVADNNLLNASLVPVKALSAATGGSSGLAFVDNFAFRTTAPGSSAAGVIERVNLSTGDSVRPTRVVESPLLPGTAAQTSGGAVGPNTSFTRTLAPLLSRNTIISLSQSGFTVLAYNYDAAVAIPALDRIVNSADETRPVAPGGLVSIFGRDLSPINIATREIPLPTALADSCLTVNGTLIPLILASPTRINAQLPFNVDGSAQLVLRTPGGVSNNLNFTILPNAPAIFRTQVVDEFFPLVVRTSNNTVVTLANPVHKGDMLTIYLTGMGVTDPILDAGLPSPSDPLAAVATDATVQIDGATLPVEFAGLAPGQIGVYQINARVPFGIQQGLQIPLEITQGGFKTTVAVRVVE